MEKKLEQQSDTGEARGDSESGMRCSACGFEISGGAKFCQECGAPQASKTGAGGDAAASSRLSQSAERRQLTVVFCDLVGSASLSTKLDAEHLRELIAAYHDVAGIQVSRYGGHVAQYLGDGILIYFGYPQAFEDSAYRAVKTSLEILAGMKRLNARLAQQGDVRLDVRIGMHTGEVVVGEVGAVGAVEKLALGETPNIAARVQDLAPPNSILITDATAELVARKVRSDFRGAHTLKGVPRPVRIHGVVAERTLLDEEIIAASTPLVNREDETQILRQALDAAREGTGGALLLSGAAGIGKSRILQYLRQQLDYPGGEQRLEFRCSANHQDSSLHPFVEQLQLQCQFAAEDGTDVKLQKLSAVLAETDETLLASLPIFAGLLSLPPPPDADPVDPQALKELTQQALEQWILGRARQSLMLLVFEDVHWMDPSSLDVIGRLLPLFPAHRCILAMTCRPEFKPPWEEAGLQHIVLERLGAGHIEQIIRNVGGNDNLPPTLLRQLVDRVDGVPIFAEELARNLMDNPYAQPGTGESGPGQSDLSIPSSLQDTLMSRLDSLNMVRGVAQIASVLGREFDFGTLLKLTGDTEAQVAASLTQLVDGDVLLQSGTVPDARYMFRHALLQEAAYNSLLRRRRTELHARMGEILEHERQSQGTDRVDASLVRMAAYHWPRAVAQINPDEASIVRAVDSLIEVGTLELGLSGYKEAERQLNNALKHIELLPEGRQSDEFELTARLRLSMVCMATVGWASDQARDTFSACRDLCLRLGDRPELAQVLYGFWGYNLFRANYPKAKELAREAHDVALASDNSDFRLQTHAALANSHFWLGDLEDADSHADQVLAEYDPKLHAAHRVLYGMDPGVFALMFAVWVPWLQGKSVTAERNHRELQRVTGELDHPLSLALALNTSCCFHVNRGDVAGAREAGEALLKLAQDCGLPVYVMFGVLFRGWAIAAEGNVDQVVDEVAETYRNYVT